MISRDHDVVSSVIIELPWGRFELLPHSKEINIRIIMYFLQLEF
jgi:hypothetical protein